MQNACWISTGMHFCFTKSILRLRNFDWNLLKCDFYWFPTSVVYQQENRQCFGERMSDVKLCTYWLQIRHRDKKKIIKKALKLQIFKVGKKLAEFELMTIKMIETRKSSSGERQIKRVITSIKKFQHKKLF